MTTRKIVNRIISRCVKVKSGCWEWQKCINVGGYGRLRIGDKGYTTHRLMYEYVHGKIPDGLVIRHKCNNRLCNNPDHLIAGTKRENNEDMALSGINKGSKNGQSKLCEEEVEVIREVYAKGGVSTYELAERFGVSDRNINMIINRKTWGWLE